MTNDHFCIIDDELCVYYTIRYENLAGDFNDVWVDALPHLKGGMRREGHLYSEYFDGQSQTIVEEVQIVTTLIHLNFVKPLQASQIHGDQ